MVFANRTVATRTVVQNRGTQFFVTDYGEYGVAANSIREGDILCQFADCDVAAIIRQERGLDTLVSRAIIAPELCKEEELQHTVGRPSNELVPLKLDINTLRALTCLVKQSKVYKYRDDIVWQDAGLRWEQYCKSPR